jgi:hypothetical protein
LRKPQRDSGRALRQGRANCTAQFKFGELGGEMLLKLRTRALVVRMQQTLHGTGCCLTSEQLPAKPYGPHSTTQPRP